MRGRLTLARALLHRPELLFLDEPTAGLDPVTARRIRQVIRDVREAGATVFLTTHDMVTADDCATEWPSSWTAQIAALDSPRSLRIAHGRRSCALKRCATERASTARVSVGGSGGRSQTFWVIFDQVASRRFTRSRPRSRTSSFRSLDGRWHERLSDGAPMGCRRPSEEWILLGERVRGSRHRSAPACPCRRPPRDQCRVGAGVLAINLQITTFFFVAGLMLLERDEGTLTALASRRCRPAATWRRVPSRLTVLPQSRRSPSCGSPSAQCGSWSRFLVGPSTRRHLYRFWSGVGTCYELGQRAAAASIGCCHLVAAAAASTFWSCTTCCRSCCTQSSRP